MQLDHAEPYSACPYCLTKIPYVQLEPPKPEKPVEKKQKSAGTPASCRYHLGYLSEREQKEQIPDDCIVCIQIVECMLQKMKN